MGTFSLRMTKPSSEGDKGSLNDLMSIIWTKLFFDLHNHRSQPNYRPLWCVSPSPPSLKSVQRLRPLSWLCNLFVCDPVQVLWVSLLPGQVEPLQNDADSFVRLLGERSLIPDRLKQVKQLRWGDDSSHLHVVKSNFEPWWYLSLCLQEMRHWAINLEKKSSDDKLPCEGKAGDFTDGPGRHRRPNIMVKHIIIDCNSSYLMRFYKISKFAAVHYLQGS